MKEDKPPRKKVSTRRNNPEDMRGTVPGSKETPAAAERTDAESVKQGPPTPSGDRDVRRLPVTNQDEQEKITNASESDLPVEE